jgi:outer membrane protein assembly factor BamA
VVTLEGSLTAVFFDRRLELVAGTVTQHAEIPRIRDKDGDVIAEADPAFEQDLRRQYYGVRWDYTDDYADPRKGIRTSLFRSHTDNDGNAESAEYFVWDFNLSGFVPLGKQSTLALNYFRSDAQVTRQGNTDTAALLLEVGVLCPPGDAACIAARDDVVERLRNERKHGTATDLGGDVRLRAYPQSRFSGAHSVLYSAELRWNLTEEVTPFNYFIWKDVRTAVQLAFFAELGSVSESLDTLGADYRSDVGVGLRLVSASGFVYRADWASGDEGNEVTIIFNYPF